jgi:hypothetical protein
MESQQMMELLLIRMNASMKEHTQEMKADRKSDRENLKGMMDEMMNDNQAEMRSAVCAIRSEFETLQHEIKGVLSYVEQKTQNLRMELTVTIGKTQMKLQIAEMSLDKRTRDVEEKIASIIENISSNKRKFQSQLAEVNAVAEWGSRPNIRHERSSATKCQREYIVQRVPAPIPDCSGEQPVVGPR